MEITKAMYEFALGRIEQLLPITEDSMDDPNMAEPTLKVARMLCKILAIHPSEMLGVA